MLRIEVLELGLESGEVVGSEVTPVCGVELGQTFVSRLAQACKVIVPLVGMRFMPHRAIGARKEPGAALMRVVVGDGA